MGPATNKKRKLGVTAPETIEFDFAAREEYLTGFHKRKLARIKHAQEENAKREKEEKLRMRREVRFFFSLLPLLILHLIWKSGRRKKERGKIQHCTAAAVAAAA